MIENKATLLLAPLWDKIYSRSNLELDAIKNAILENKALVVLAATSGLAVSSFAYYVFSQYRLYKKYQHIPGPSINNFLELLFGNYKELEDVKSRKKIMSEKLAELSEVHGPIVKLQLLNQVLVLVNEPEAIKKLFIDQDAPKIKSVFKKMSDPLDERFLGGGLVTEIDKEKWRRNRSMLNHAFHRSNLDKYTEEFNAQGNIMMEKLRNLADGKQYIKMLEQFNRATLDVIGKVAFGLNINSLEDSSVELNVHLTNSLQAMTELFFTPGFQINPANYSKIKTYKHSIRYLREFAKQKILERIKEMQAEGYVVNDMFSILFQASKENQLEFEVLIDEFLTLFAAGQETTAVSLTFAVLELGRNPNVLSILREEVDRVLGHRRDITNEDLIKLEYTGYVFKESLRKWPAATFLSRTVDEDTSLGGHVVPKGTWIVLSPFVIGRNPKYFPDPEKFRPERFINKENITSYTFFPFGMGTRTCIGQNFAQIEGKILLAKFVQNFDFLLDPNQSFAVEECLTVRPVDGCRVKLSLRQ